MHLLNIIIFYIYHYLPTNLINPSIGFVKLSNRFFLLLIMIKHFIYKYYRQLMIDFFQ